MSWDSVVRDCGSAEEPVDLCRSFEPVTMTDKNTEIRVAVVSFLTVVPLAGDLIPHRHWWPCSSNQSDSRAFVSGRHALPTL